MGLSVAVSLYHGGVSSGNKLLMSAHYVFVRVPDVKANASLIVSQSELYYFKNIERKCCNIISENGTYNLV